MPSTKEVLSNKNIKQLAKKFGIPTNKANSLKPAVLLTLLKETMLNHSDLPDDEEAANAWYFGLINPIVSSFDNGDDIDDFIESLESEPVKSDDDADDAEDSPVVTMGDPNLAFKGQTGYVTMQRKRTNDERIYKMSTQADFKKNNGESPVLFRCDEIAVLETGGGQGATSYKDVIMQGKLYDEANSTVGKEISLQTNTNLFKAMKTSMFKGFEFDGDVPILEGATWLNIVVKEQKAGVTISRVTDAKQVAVIKAANGEITLRKKKSVGYIFDATDSDQESFVRFKGVAADDDVRRINVYLDRKNTNKADDESYASRKSIDFASARANAKQAGGLLQDLIDSGLSAAVAQTILMGKL